MKKLILVGSLTLANLLVALPSFAKDIRVPFASGSYCGTYAGRVSPGDNFVLNLAPEQQFIIEQSTPHNYSVIAPNGKILPIIRSLSGSEQYWTGNQSGDFKVKVNSVPQGLQIKIHFCAYTGEGAL